MKIETMLAREGVCANCGGCGCVQCRPASANNECPNCGGRGCAQCHEATSSKANSTGLTEIACYIARTDPQDRAGVAYLLVLSLIDCRDSDSLLLLSITPDQDYPAENWESAAIVIAMEWWRHIQQAPNAPDHFTVTTFETNDGRKLTVGTTIPKVWDEMSFFEVSMGGLKVVGWVEALDMPVP
ncbi:hypothetical protein [Terricaulis sp.]|uniref:hypothetical protein n=1 Tax=Terricaulis sp. TaxID=2768686 RepID=UPI002AC46F0F|nr:hypothetical protein [Terricaulis sp.]MDZ4689708.1 hypothetical protein [Terricaulis sp.]